MNQNLTLNDFLKEHLQNKRIAAMFLEECLADGDIELFKKALKDVADTQFAGATALSRDVELNHQSLYHSLSEDDNLQLDTLVKTLDALGLRMTINIKGRTHKK